MIIPNLLGSICSGKLGSVYSEQVGSVSSEEVGSVLSEFPDDKASQLTVFIPKVWPAALINPCFRLN